MINTSTDVLIVGSGVAGALLAHGLTQKGIKVTVLEAGPRVNRGEAKIRFQNASIKTPESPYLVSAFSPHPLADQPTAFYIQKGPDVFNATYLKQVGGTTWHWLGTAVRLVPDDFILQSKFGVGVDWPISYADLEPWYGKAEKALGVSGDNDDDLGSPRSTAYPLPKIPQSYLDSVWAKALAHSPYHVSATPQARLSKAMGNRPACCGAASCIPICPIQAKYDATVHVDLAEKQGAIIYSETVAVLIETDNRQHVRAVHVKRPDGSSARITASVIVLAANAMETPRLLLSSAAENAPNGVANHHDQVGRYLMDHPIQLSWALSKNPVWPYRGPLSTSGIETLRSAQWRTTRPALRFEIHNDGWSWPVGEPVETARRFAQQGLRGAKLHHAIQEEMARHICVAALVEQLPLAENRVTLDTILCDPSGLRRPVIHYRLDDYVHKGLQKSRRVHEDIFQRLDASDIQHAMEPKSALHILGTTRMGQNPKTSVVNKHLRAHSYRNLFIVGGSVFPTGGTGNPTLTIAALALRAVSTIAMAVQE